MKIHLYQIVLELDEQCLAFREMSYFRSVYREQFPSELYEMVFCGDVNISTPEEAFEMFNIAHPTDYRGRSMSMSDVLEIVYSSEESEFFFCDSVGFKQIQFEQEKSMAQILNHDFERVLEIRQNVTAYFIGNRGLASEHCSKFVLRRCRYSQSQLGYQIQYFPWREFQPRTVDSLTRPKIILTNSLAPFPRQMLYEEDHGVERTRYPVHSEDNLDIVLAWLKQRHLQFEVL